MIHYNTLVVLGGVSLLGAAAGMIGAFAVLRKRALTGDALSHAALPGLCIAFLILRERNLPAMLLGALASGVAGVMIISALTRWTRVREDAAIGIVLSVPFGFGLVLSKIIQDMKGVGSKAGLDSYIFGKTAGMTLDDVWLILIAAAFCLVAVILLYKEFLSISFDLDFARSLGWPVYGLDLLLMSLVAVAVVIGLPAVGVVLISALLIVPGAAARFWTDRLGTLLVLAGGFGFTIGLVGTWLSASFYLLPAGPVIVLTGTSLFLISLLFGRRRGLLARVIDQRRFERELGLRQFLRVAWEALERQHNPDGIVPHTVFLDEKQWPARLMDQRLDQARRAGLIEPEASGFRLTPSGREAALATVRGQRLWEALLTEYPELAGSVANLAKQSIDEFVAPTVVQQLTEQLRLAGRWPEAAR